MASPKSFSLQCHCLVVCCTLGFSSA
ncbi:hypothetical protein EE612_053159 [Oryza sativa]|nr:hypothetical protein EE612_053159 [Oryza sativa]